MRRELEATVRDVGSATVYIRVGLAVGLVFALDSAGALVWHIAEKADHVPYGGSRVLRG